MNTSLLVPFSAIFVAATKQRHALYISVLCGQANVPKVSLKGTSIGMTMVKCEPRMIPPWPSGHAHKSKMTDELGGMESQTGAELKLQTPPYLPYRTAPWRGWAANNAPGTTRTFVSSSPVSDAGRNYLAFVPFTTQSVSQQPRSSN